MTFLNPLVLIGLVAAAIPLVIHLFNFRRPQRLDFSSLALLQALQRTTLQRVRIQQWFLLSLRTLAISALICAFARPVVVVDAGSRFLGQAHVSMAIVVDSSPSMTLRTGAMSQFDRALELVDAFLRTQDPGDEVFLFGSEGASAARDPSGQLGYGQCGRRHRPCVRSSCRPCPSPVPDRVLLG